MKHIFLKTIALGILFASLSAFAESEHQLEIRYNNVQLHVLTGARLKNFKSDKITADAVFDVTLGKVSLKIRKRIKNLIQNKISFVELELADQIRLSALEERLAGASLHKELVQSKIIETTQLDERIQYELERAYDVFPEFQYRIPMKSFGRGVAYSPPTQAALQELFFKKPNLDIYKNGVYSEVPRLFMFCSHQRNYPCLMVLKDTQDKPVYLADGKTLWTHLSLGYAHSGKASNERNGYTPSGVYEVNGVMPVADQQGTFGKNRRLILDFVPKSTNETNHSFVLTPESLKANWWKEAKVARDIGRNLLRIHGTGKSNWDPFSTYKPFVATSGCIAQRETKKYVDQRKLLDTLMKASGLEAKYENETKIKALLYVVEITNTKGPVTLSLLNSLGLK